MHVAMCFSSPLNYVIMNRNQHMLAVNLMHEYSLCMHAAHIQMVDVVY